MRSKKPRSTSRPQASSRKSLPPAANSKRKSTSTRIISAPYIDDSDLDDQESGSAKTSLALNSPSSLSFGPPVWDADAGMSVNTSTPSMTLFQHSDGTNGAVSASQGLSTMGMGFGTAAPVPNAATSFFGNPMPGPTNSASLLSHSTPDTSNLAGFDISTIPSGLLDNWTSIINEFNSNRHH